MSRVLKHSTVSCDSLKNGVSIGHRPLNGLTCDWLLKIQKIYGQHARLDIYDIVYAFLPLYTEIITNYF